MTLTEQVKIPDNKIRADKAQYDLDREAAKISALSSGELEKYEYLTGEDLGYKPNVVKKAKFEYSPLGKVFNTGLDESDEKEGLLKRLKNTEDKNEEQLKMTKNKKDNLLGIKSVTHILDQKLSLEAKNVLAKLSNQEEIIKYAKLDFRRDNNLKFEFSDYRSLKKLFRAIYYRNLSIDNAERIKDEFMGVLSMLERYRPRNLDYVTAGENHLINAKNFYDGRKMIIDAFKNKRFPFGVEEPEDLGKRPDESDDEFYTPR